MSSFYTISRTNMFGHRTPDQSRAETQHRELHINQRHQSLQLMPLRHSPFLWSSLTRRSCRNGELYAPAVLLWLLPINLCKQQSAVPALPSNQACLTSHYFPALGAQADNWQGPVKQRSDAFSLSKNLSHRFVSKRKQRGDSSRPEVLSCVCVFGESIHKCIFLSSLNITNYVRHTTFIAFKQSRLYHIYNSH